MHLFNIAQKFENSYFLSRFYCFIRLFVSAACFKNINSWFILFAQITHLNMLLNYQQLQKSMI